MNSTGNWWIHSGRTFKKTVCAMFGLTLGTECVFLQVHVATTLPTALDSPNHEKSIGTKKFLSGAIFSVKIISPKFFFVSILLPALNWTFFPLLSQISKSPFLSHSNWSNLQKMTRVACHSIIYGQNWPKRRIILKTDLESPEVGASAQPFTISVMFLLWSQF